MYICYCKFYQLKFSLVDFTSKVEIQREKFSLKLGNSTLQIGEILLYYTYNFMGEIALYGKKFYFKLEILL